MALDNAYRQKIIRDLGPTGLELLRQGKLDDDTLEQYASAKGITPDDFSGVTSSVDTTGQVPEARPAQEAGFLSDRGNELSTQLDQVGALGSAAIDAVQSYAQRRLSSDILNAQDQQAQAQANRPQWAQDSFAGDLLYGNPFADLTQAADVAVSRLARGEMGGDFTQGAILDEAGRLRSESAVNRQRAESTVQGITTARGLAEAMVDVAGSPSSSLSVFGGPLGGLPVAEVYQDSYADARLRGLSPEDARTYATAQAAPEAIGFIPAGRFLDRIPGADRIKKALANEVSSTAARVSTRLAATSLGEGAEEGVTQLLQTGANAAIAATADDEVTRQFAESQLPQNAADLWGQVWRATKAGMVGGAGLGAPQVGYQVAIENANAYMDTLTSGLEASRALTRTAEPAAITDALDLPPVQEQIEALAEPAVEPAPVVVEPTPSETVQEPVQEAPIEPSPTPAVNPLDQVVEQDVKPKEQEVRTSLRELFPDVDEAEIDRMTAEELGTGPKTQLARQPTQDGTYENTAEATVRDIAARVRGGNDKVANSLGKLIAKKKLVVVNDESEIPNFDPRNSGATGIYDSQSGTMYAVANRIDPKNMVGEMLHVAAHETKHAADEAGDPALRAGSLKTFVGDQANARFVKKLEALAERGNKLAQRVYDEIPQGMSESELQLELPAYALNMALETRGNLGAFSGLKQDLISAIRTNAKSKLGITDVNENDLSYLAKKLVERNSLSDALATGAGVPVQQAMIYGPKSTQFRQALRQGITFEARDGTTKYVLSDKDSSIKPAAISKLENSRPGEGVRLEEILRHPTLYDQYPQLRDLPVMARGLKNEGWGEYRWGAKDRSPDIGISPALLRGAETMTPDGDVVNLRTALLHEVQHAVQDIEGQSSQFAREPVPTGPAKEALLAKQRAERALDSADRKVMTNLDGLARGNEVTAMQRRILLSTINDNSRPENERVKEAISYLEDENIFVSDELRADLDNRETLRAQYNETVPAFNAVSRQNYEQYRRNTTEQDAFFTQNNADVAQESLPINPEETYERIVDVPGQLAMMRLPQVRDSILEATKAARAKGVAGHDNPFWNSVFGAVSYTGGLGKEIRDKIDLAVGNAANISEMARHNMKNLEIGIEALAKRWVQEGKATDKDAGIKQVNTMLARRMEALKNIESVQRRESGIANLVNQYPELRPFARAMTDIRELTEALVQQHKDATPNPTPKDKKFQQDMLDNVLAYTTRMYGAFQGPDGRTHSKKMLKDAKRAAEKMANNKQISATEREAYDTYQSAISYLIQNDIQIPEADVLDTLRDSKLNDLYNTWMPQQASDVREIAYRFGRDQLNMERADAEAYASQTIREQLSAKRTQIKPEDLVQKADAAVNELLRLRSAQGPTAQRYAGLDVDRGIFKRRSQVPKEIRDLLGEIRDPVTMLGVTQAKQGELLARNKLLMQLKDAGLVVTQDKANTPEFAAFTERLSGEGAGPLKDQYTTPRVAMAINSSVELYSQVGDAMANAWLDTDGIAQSAVRGGLATVKWGAGKAKVLSLIAEGFGTAANALGSPIMLAANGVIDPRATYRGAAAGLNSIADVLFSGKGDVSPLLARGIKYQVVDSARVQELRRSSQKYIKSKLSSRPKVASKASQMLSTGWATAVETFAMSDAWVKLAAFEDRSNYLREFYKAEGVAKTPGQIDEEAANDIRDSNITYSKTPPILRTGESYGLTTFLPYFYNVPRSLARSMYLGAQDIMRAKNAKTPEGRNAAALAGIKRVTGTAAAMAVVPAATLTVAKWVSKMVMPGDNDEEKEKKLEALKKTLAREGRFGDPVYLGEDNKGRPVFFRASRLDPYGPVTDLVRIALDDSIGAAEASDQMSEAITSLIFTNRFTGAALETVGGQTPTNQETRLERTFPEVTSAIKQVLKPVVGFTAAKASMRMLDSFAPGAVDALDPGNTGVADGGTEMSELLSKFVVGIGGRLDKGDPAARARQLGFEIGDRRKRAREELFDAVSGRESPASLEKIIKDASFDIYDHMAQLSDVYDGATEGMGLSPRKAMTILKEEGKLTANEIANIRRGIPKSYETEDLAIELGRVLSRKSIEQRTKKRGRYETPEEVEQFDNETKELIKRLKNRGLKENE